MLNYMAIAVPKEFGVSEKVIRDWPKNKTNTNTAKDKTCPEIYRIAVFRVGK